MAGIVGIVSLGNSSGSDLVAKVCDRMIGALKLDERQKSASFRDEMVFCANTLPLSAKTNNRLIVNRKLGIVCAVDGFIQIPEELLINIRRIHAFTELINDYEAIPFLYATYGEKIARYLTGNYNLFCYNQQTKRTLLINDRFGFLPMYYYQDDRWFVFASKIECVLASGLCKHIEFDRVTIAEHLLFNYPLSDNTYIRHIKSMPNATSFTIGTNFVVKEKYWSIGDDFSDSGLSTQDSFDLIDSSLSKAVHQAIGPNQETSNFSLTGGWDSRVVLSYLLPEYRLQLNCYSFGTRDSADVTIPGEIARKEKLEYTPFVLDDEYLKDAFWPMATQTIELSGGSRSYKRAHYLYAIKNVGALSDTLITGIFGDQVFKVGRPQGGAVLSTNTIGLLDSDFEWDPVNSGLSPSSLFMHPYFSAADVQDEFCFRISEIKNQLKQYASQAEKYVSFRFEINLRKYFGNEASSYNDFVHCRSPFFDYGFVKAWLRTIYAGQRFDFSSAKLANKQRSSALYTKLVMKNYPRLAGYDSSRGFSMAETTSLLGWGKILHRKYVKKKDKLGGGFYSPGTEKQFKRLLKTELGESPDMFKLPHPTIGNDIEADALSLRYWMHVIQEKYS